MKIIMAYETFLIMETIILHLLMIMKPSQVGYTEAQKTLLGLGTNYMARFSKKVVV